MKTWSIFAARDGSTFRDQILAVDEEAATEEGLRLTAAEFRMSDEFVKAKAGLELDLFTAELDGFTVEEVELSDAELVMRYDAELNALGLPPNGEDYNAIIAMVNGGPYTSPHTEGR